MTGPDRADLERWAAAMGEVAERIERDRGVADPWSLSVQDDVLWANYGDLRVRLGPGADVHDEAELFDEVDGWVAFDRQPGPGAVLDRDVEAVAARRTQLPALRAFWEPVVARVLADVTRTTSVDVTWSIEVVEREVGVPPGPGLWLTFGAQELPVRETFPSLVVRLPHQWFDLRPIDDVEEAAAELAGLVQDHVVEELPGAWPVCPGHHHPMAHATTPSGRAAWGCPSGAGPVHEVGSLPG